MKTFKIIIKTLATAVVISSCNTKHLGILRSNNKEEKRESESMRSRHSEIIYSNRIIAVSDSANHLYRLNIFPLDTFSFSIQDGFKGRASRIEVTGVEQEVRRITENSTNDARKNQEIDHNKGINIRTKSESKSKLLKKERSVVIGLIIAVIAGILSGIYWWNRKNIKQIRQ